MRTERLVVRRFTVADLDDFLAYQGDALVRRHARGRAMTPREARTYLTEQSTLHEHVLGAWHGWAVELQATGTMIGDVGVFLQLRPTATGDVGFQLGPRWHGRGYAHEAMVALLEHLFGTLGLEAVTATCSPANEASQRLMGRLGMTLAHERDDEVQYALARRTWLASRPSRPPGPPRR